MNILSYSKVLTYQLVLIFFAFSYNEAIAFRRDPRRLTSSFSITPARLLRQFSTVEIEKHNTESDSTADHSYQNPTYETDGGRYYEQRTAPKFVQLDDVVSMFRSAKSSSYSKPSTYSEFKPIANPYLHRGEKVRKPVPIYGPPKQDNYKVVPAYATSYGGGPSKLNDNYGPPEKSNNPYNSLPRLTEPGETYSLPQSQASSEESYTTPSSFSSEEKRYEVPSSTYGVPSSTYGPPPPVTTPSPFYGTPAAPVIADYDSSKDKSTSYGTPLAPVIDNYESNHVSPSYGPPQQAEKREIRFIIHKPGEEEIVKHAVVEDAKHTGDQISFVKGPDMDIHHNQKIYLPPPKKTIIYVLLKEPQIKTTVQVMDPKPEEIPKPEVFVIYESANGVIKKHYDLSPEEGQKVANVLAEKIRHERDSSETADAKTKLNNNEVTVNTSVSKSVSKTISSTSDSKH